MGQLAVGERASGSAAASPDSAKRDARSMPKAAATDFLFSAPSKPMLFLLLDLGVRTVGPRTLPVQVSRSRAASGAPSPAACAVWAVHARGHDADVYGCITAMKANLAITTFWAAITPGANEEGYRSHPKKTMRFRRLAAGYRLDMDDAAEERPASKEGVADDGDDSVTEADDRVE
jgi:hypothetical protein